VGGDSARTVGSAFEVWPKPLRETDVLINIEKE
jgi:hypothetical protein